MLDTVNKTISLLVGFFFFFKCLALRRNRDVGLMAKSNCIHGVRSTGQGAGPAVGWPLPHANSSPILEGMLLPGDHKSQGWGQDPA